MDVKEYMFKRYGLVEGKPPYFIPIMREELGSIFKDLGFKVGAEIGVERGIFSKSILEQNPGMKLYCVDAWKVYKGYRDHVNQDKITRYYEETKKRLKPFDVEIIRDWSMEAVKKIPDESLDFVYIDGNHDFQHVTNDIVEWSKKVRKGGIIAGHDYVKRRSSVECQVKGVVDAMTYMYRINPWFVLTGNPFSSWLWIKR